MNTARQRGEGDYLRIKALFRRLVQSAGGCEHAAEMTRVGKTLIHEYYNPRHAVFPPADVILDLETAIDDPIVSRAMVRLVGETAVPVKPMADGDVIRLGAGIAKEVGEFMAVALDAAKDGRLDAGELESAIKEAQDVLMAAQKAHDDLCNLKAAREGSAQIDRVRVAG